MVFERSLLRRTFHSNEDELIGGWRQLNNNKLHNLYPSPDVIGMIKSRRSKWARHVVRIAVTGFLMEKQEGKMPLGRPRRR
jgi:CelD/BcsL family acetyltransferase involved in cellulose biosynthesis